MSDTVRSPTSPPGDLTRTQQEAGVLRPMQVGVAASAERELSPEAMAQFRRRLTVLSLIGLCAIGVLALILTPFYIQSKTWHYLAVVWFLVAMTGTSFAVLRSGVPITARMWRAFEVGVIGSLAAILTWNMYFQLFGERFGAVFASFSQMNIDHHLRPLAFQEPGQPVFHRMREWMMWALSGWQMLPWVLLVVFYSIFFPNPWKRAAVVLGGISAIPIVLMGVLCWLDPEVEGKQAGLLMMATTVTMTFVAALAILGSYRNENLRREATAARRLGQYQLKELLGAGGMGEVYRAEHVLLRRPCAVKLIRPERGGDPKDLARFEREVQATATLTNWHTVEIYDYGHADDGTFYYVMEYLPGLTLDALVRRDGPLPPARAVHILRQICAALREAHAIGLIHRDIKPGNIIVGQRGGLPDVAKLLDFGLVRAAGLDSPGDKLTQTGVLVGTPAFMSPEQAAGAANLDARSDIYSLGALAYSLLSGQPPFAGKSPLQVLAAHLHESAAPLAGLPADLDAVVRRCMEKEPAKRYQTIADLDDALAQCGCAR